MTTKLTLTQSMTIAFNTRGSVLPKKLKDIRTIHRKHIYFKNIINEICNSIMNTSCSFLKRFLPICPKTRFSGKWSTLTFVYLLHPFMPHLKKFLRVDHEIKGSIIWGNSLQILLLQLECLIITQSFKKILVVYFQILMLQTYLHTNIQSVGSGVVVLPIDTNAMKKNM